VTDTNDSGFKALPGGYCDSSGHFYYVFGSDGFWWSSEALNDSLAWSRHLYWASRGIDRDSYDKRYGFSVRCIKDKQAFLR
jgi:uncharacterized protein (TIGR02145 family)